MDTSAAVERASPSHRAHPTRPPMRWLAIAGAVALAAGVVSVSVGPVGVGVGDALQVVLDRVPLIDIDHGVDARIAAIVADVRLPRVLLAAMVGSVLATAGGAYQATFRNPLADPFLLGAAAGAGLGVTIALSGAGASLGDSGVGVTTAAFVGAMLAVIVAYALGSSVGERSGASLILAGVAVAALFSALQNLLLQRDDEAIRDVYSWLLGRFNVAGWDEVRLLAPSALVTIAVLVAAGRRLDLLALGDDEAYALGVDAARLRLVVVTAATFATAAAVAVSGLIGFVGIVVPHAIRLRVGPSYRRILPLAAILGAPFLCLADLLARTMLAPAEIPIGVVTAIVGAPFFLFLLRRNRVSAM
ncbi:MAG: iron ABC transporter permease [Actinomycetota bacterium]